MSNLIELMYLFLVLILTGLSIIYFIAQKRENSPILLKYIIMLLLGVSVIIFILNSLPIITSASELEVSSESLIFSNIPLFLLCISAALFIYSLNSSNGDVIELDHPSYFKSRKGKIKIGRSLKGQHKKHKFFLSLKDLEKHMFICGATGTGKTTFLQHFLVNFTKRHKIPFMLVEFKGEYHFLQRKIENLLIIRPGENFSINIFNPGNSAPEVHAERVFDILKSGKFLDESAEFSPQMEKVLVDILTKICGDKQLQSWKGFYDYCKDYVKTKKQEIPMLSQTLISITNRIRRFSLGSLKAIFDTDHEIKIDNIFQRNILIDLSSIIRLGGEKEDALFFLNMLLKHLWDINLTRGAYNFNGIKHITVVEDTQYFAPRNLSRQNKLTTYLEDIALLQRGTGECLISLATHPDISQEILANCGVLVCFKTHMEKDFLGKLLNLDPENEGYLSILEEGECIIRVNSIKRPFLLKVPNVKREWLEMSEINRNNRNNLDNLENGIIEKAKTPNFKLIQKIKEKSVKSMNKINDKIKGIKNKLKKKVEEKDNASIGIPYHDSNKIYLEREMNIDEEDENEREAFEKLKIYIEKLAAEQEKSS